MKKMTMMLFMALIMLVSILFSYQGISMHNKVTIEEAKFHQLQEEYFLQSKEVRDSAPTNSDLNIKIWF